MSCLLSHDLSVSYLGIVDRLVLGFMYCMIFARRTFSLSSSSGSIAAALRFRDAGAGGADTRIMLFAIRTRWGSGSRQSGGEVASFGLSSVPQIRSILSQ